MKYILLILVCLTAELTAQSAFNADSFEVTKADLELNVYEKDSTANALIIREEGLSDMNSRTLDLETEVKKKIKILNNEGFEYAELTFNLFKSYDGEQESIKNIKATVYNLEGEEIEKTKLKKTSIFEDQVNEQLTTIKIVFPKIKKGSVVVYSYTKVSPFIYKYKGWEFQDIIPKIYIEYTASIPNHFEYNAKLVGDLKLTSKELTEEPYCTRIPGSNAVCNVSRYVMIYVPAFIEEDYTTTKNNYLSRIEYELTTIRGYYDRVVHLTKSWDIVDNQILNDTHLGRELNKTNNYQDIVSEKITKNDSPFKKAKTIFKHIQENYKWNGVERALKGVFTENLVENKSGNVGEINLLLYLLLNAYNIDVQLLVLSTRDNGFATQIYPTMSDFNYLIIKAEIDGKTYLLDATDKHLAFGELPFRCLNHHGRLLDFVNGSSWYDIKVNDTSIQQYSYTLDIDTQQNITSQIDFEATGYHALPLKQVYFENEDAIINSFTNTFNAVDILNFEVKTTEKTSKSFESTFEVQNTAELIGDNIYLNPILFKFFSKNPFQLQERSYPIDFGYKDTYIYKIKVNVADAYKISEIPKTINAILPNREAAFMFSAQVNENQVLLYFKLSFNQPTYSPEHYDGLKQIMSKVMEAQNNTIIVLKKK